MLSCSILCASVCVHLLVQFMYVRMYIRMYPNCDFVQSSTVFTYSTYVHTYALCGTYVHVYLDPTQRFPWYAAHVRTLYCTANPYTCVLYVQYIQCIALILTYIIPYVSVCSRVFTYTHTCILCFLYIHSHIYIRTYFAIS